VTIKLDAISQTGDDSAKEALPSWLKAELATSYRTVTTDVSRKLLIGHIHNDTTFGYLIRVGLELA